MSLKLTRTFLSTSKASLRSQFAMPNFHKKFSTVATESKKPPRKVSKGTDFLLNHGGKVALVALSVSTFLIYTYYLSIKNRNQVEEDVEKSTIIEPYELQQLRYANNISKEDYLDIVQQVQQQYQQSNGFVSYREFVQTIQNTQALKKQRPLSNGHLLDRMVHQHITNNNSLSEIVGKPEEFQAEANSWYDELLPVDYLLVLLSLAMEPNAVNRLEAYHVLLKQQEALRNGSAASGETHGAISDEQVLRLLRLLQITDQLPPEKQVIETGVKYPVKLHRRKTPQDMLLQYRKHVAKKKEIEESKASTIQIDWENEKEFENFFRNYQVCVWGSCYRERN